ncbi:MAG: CCA tRNA nucleotidyltransferase [Planctomycetota bacterium]|jgi:tRNA nucleotidyltransferase/poly(A) polymerase
MRSLSQSELDLPEDVLDAAERIRAAGSELYLTGGALRDHRLGLPVEDWDLASPSPPAVLQDLFPEAEDVDLRYGRLCLRKKPVEIVITSFREDGPYLDHRHPSTARFIESLDSDARRRDFSINAIYQSLPDGQIQDPVAGLEDLRAGVLRAIGDPVERLREDPLRILRGVKFAARLGFEIESATAAAMCAVAGSVAELSPARQYAELEVMLSGPGRGRAYELLREFELLPRVLRNLLDAAGQPQADLAGWLEAMPLGRPVLSWASLLQPLARPAEVDAILKGLAAPRRLRAEVRELCRAQAKLARGEWFTPIDGQENHEEFLRARQRVAGRDCSATQQLNRLDTMRGLDSMVSGEDLIALGVPPGPMRGEILGELLASCEVDGILDRDRTHERLRQLVQARIKAPSPQVDKKRRDQ